MKRPLLLLSILAGAALLWGVIRWQSVKREEWISKATLEELQTANRERPDQADILLKLGSELNESGEANLAEPLLRRAAELDPSSESIWVQLSRSMRTDQDAFHLLRERIKSFPESQESRSELSRRLAGSGEGSEALDISEKTCSEYPNGSDAWEAYGEVLSSLRRQKAAEEAFYKSIKLKDNAEARLALAQTFIPLQNYDRIEELCAPLVAAKPQISVSKRQRLRAVIYHAGARLSASLSDAEIAGMLERLRDAEERATNLAPRERFLASYFLGAGLLRSGKPNEAIPPLKRCVELNPQFPGGLFSLARAYRLGGDAAKSRETLERQTRQIRALVAMELLNSRLEANPDDAAALLDLAKKLSEVGNSEGAIALCHRLIDSGKPSDEAKRLLKSLEVAKLR